MTDTICPICGKTNPGAVESCQYCGTILKTSPTEPLPPIHPGELPEKKKTSDLERTLPGWLREARKTSQKDKNLQKSGDHSPAKDTNSTGAVLPETNNLDSSSNIDYLAGLSNLNKDDEEHETPEWLKNLQSSFPEDTQVEPTGNMLDSEQKLGDNQLTEKAEPTEQVHPEENQGFSSETLSFQFDENFEPVTKNATTAPDWLNEIFTQDKSSESTAQEGQSTPNKNTDPSIYADLPDWLAAFAGTTEVPGNLPEENPSIIQEPPNLTQENPDWLANLGGDFSTEVVALEPELQVPANSEAPDWLMRMGEGTQAPPESESTEPHPQPEQPDWLASLQASTPTEFQSIPEQEIPETSPGIEQSNWLNNLQDTDRDNNSQSSLLASALPAQDFTDTTQTGDLPDWLASLQASSSTPFQSANFQDETETSPTADQPDWSGSLQEPSATSDNPASKDVPSMESQDSMQSNELPDWLASLQDPTSTPPQPASKQELPVVPPFSEQPDWLANLESHQSPPTIGPFIPEYHLSSEEPALTQKPFQTGSLVLPNTASINSAVPDGIFPKAQETPEENFSSSEGTNPPEIESLISVPSEEKNIDSLLSMDAPDWLSTLPSEEAEKTSAYPDEESSAASDLNPGELPSWVQAMRPMESVISENDNSDQVEKQGPLAGLLSVLPSQPGLTTKRPTSSLPINLVTTEMQQAQAALLENLLKSETSSQVIANRSKTKTNHPLRWLVASILLLLITLPAALGLKIFPAPVMPEGQNPARAFFTTISTLPTNAPVLLVMDYQPGFAGEIEAAAGPLIEQLMSKQARLVFVSTSPLGELMTNRLLQRFENLYSYKKGAQYIYLGYIPGGGAGIQAFVNQPVATFGANAETGNLWETPVLKDLATNAQASLSNFAAVIIATDNPDTGRMWIEQAQPKLIDKPMLMVVSAQAEPMIRPYILSNQLSGLLAGLEGGEFYESTLGKTGSAGSYWDSLGVSILVAELIILIGGFWNLLSGIRAPNTSNEKDKS